MRMKSRSRWSRSAFFVLPLVSAASLVLEPSAIADVPFQSYYTGTYRIEFGAGSNGNNKLEFHGEGHARHLGQSKVDGDSEMAPGSAPNCTQITNDHVSLTAADGDALFLVNSGEDCLFVESGHLVVRGTGLMLVVGGSGRFEGATGQGSWVVDAPVTAFTGTGADGTFELSFKGLINY